jgi:membrane protease YdiL (CAAX protease family)
LNRNKAAVDLVLVLVTIGAVWSLRFLGVEQVGILTMGAGILLVLVLLHWRGQSFSDIGWISIFKGRALLSRTMEVMGVTFGAMVVGGLVGGALFGAPQQSSAVTQLPDNVWFFLLDVTVLTWVFIAFGEELVFRGMILNRLDVLFGLQGRTGIAVASLAQGILFGAGHASQGMTGMIMTGTIGTALAIYFMTRGQRSLMPLVISHGVIDTLVLSGSWLARTFGH